MSQSVYVLVVLYGIISIFLGIGLAIIFALWKFGIKGKLWFAWLLGGLFWFLALLLRLPLLTIISSIPEAAPYGLFIGASLAGVFETSFRVLVIILLSKFTANTAEKIYMTGLGWGTGEAFVVHTLAILQILLLPHDSEVIISLDGVEWALLFGGYERIISEIFHLYLFILVFYGIKYKLKKIEQGSPILENFFTRDPKPLWMWIIIVAVIHFAFDFFFVSLAYIFDLITLYLIGTAVVGLIATFVSNKVKYYPLFPETE